MKLNWKRGLIRLSVAAWGILSIAWVIHRSTEMYMFFSDQSRKYPEPHFTTMDYLQFSWDVLRLPILALVVGASLVLIGTCVTKVTAWIGRGFSQHSN
jgi:hypothetical protein